MKFAILKAEERGVKKGIEQGIEKNNMGVVKKSIKQGFDNITISLISSLSIEEIENIRKYI